MLQARINDDNNILVIEPFYGGSHKQLIDTLCENCGGIVKHTLPAKKWHWRARTSALHFSQVVPRDDGYRVLFCSSVLNLTELIGLRPDLESLKKILYFHENQLIYPVRKQQDRDFQYGYNQIISCVTADVVVFNSHYNQNLFLDNVQTFLGLMPDHRPKGVVELIRPKCRVIYFPMTFPGRPGSEDVESRASIELHHNASSCTHERIPKPDNVKNLSKSKDESRHQQEDKSGDEKEPSLEESLSSKKMHEHKAISDKSVAVADRNVASGECMGSDYNFGQQCPDRSSRTRSPPAQCPHSPTEPLHIVWAHRWEHDKDPTTFFECLFRLKDEGYNFKLSVMGETYTDVPDIFREANSRLSDNIVTWGYQDSKEDYFVTLSSADVAVSTAKHEFFGVAMLEAAYQGCYPLCPNQLVYPEIFPAECLYRTQAQLYKRLREFCRHPHSARSISQKIDFTRFQWSTLQDRYLELLCIT